MPDSVRAEAGGVSTSSISGSISRTFFRYRLKWGKFLPINMSSFMFSDTPTGIVVVLPLTSRTTCTAEK